ncbi:hypothetical protein Scep_028081 [Stephania cephalantha]|uniref:Uncharacterized protein n=1 Tax=Stephania cephalantha TaxID=152367 RepID=A0AAP0E984_9MAGN
MICKNDSTRLFESSIGCDNLCDSIVSKSRNSILILFIYLNILMKMIAIVGLHFPTE